MYRIEVKNYSGWRRGVFQIVALFLVVGGGPDGCWDAHGRLPWWMSSSTGDNLECTRCSGNYSPAGQRCGGVSTP